MTSSIDPKRSSIRAAFEFALEFAFAFLKGGRPAAAASLDEARPIATHRRMKSFVASLLVVTAFSIGCGKEAPPSQGSSWDPPKGSTSAAATAQASSSPAASVSAVPKAGAPAMATAVDGAILEKFLPPSGLDGVTDRTVRPAKPGTSEAVYKKGRVEVATVTISDTAPTPAVREDFKESTEKVLNYPMKTSGKTKQAILVGNRYQVTIMAASLSPEARKAWLEKMDLAGLAKVQ